mmetsp:Transcript_33075/g.53641  ORF Transcript_33075/g.53641 Transcript_33075/m.53641 type:complete len:238 (+) Transcript_33075:214-927(+)
MAGRRCRSARDGDGNGSQLQVCRHGAEQSAVHCKVPPHLLQYQTRVAVRLGLVNEIQVLENAVVQNQGQFGGHEVLRFAGAAIQVQQHVNHSGIFQALANEEENRSQASYLMPKKRMSAYNHLIHAKPRVLTQWCAINRAHFETENSAPKIGYLGSINFAQVPEIVLPHKLCRSLLHSLNIERIAKEEILVRPVQCAEPCVEVVRDRAPPKHPNVIGEDPIQKKAVVHLCGLFPFLL